MTAHQRWLREREERAGLKEAEAKRHKAEVFLKRQQDRMKVSYSSAYHVMPASLQLHMHAPSFLPLQDGEGSPDKVMP